MSDRRKITSEHIILLGLFILSLIVFGMIYLKPELTKDQGFMVLAQAVVISGLIAVATKKDTDLIAKQADALAKGNDPSWKTATPPVGATTVTTIESTTAPAEPEDAGELPESERL